MLIELLVVLVIIGFVFWALRALSGALGIPEQLVTVIYVLLVLVFLLYVLRLFGLLPTGKLW